MRNEKEIPRPSIFDTLKEKHPGRAASHESRTPPNASTRRRPPMFRPVRRSPRSTAVLVAVIVALFACGGLGLFSLYRRPADQDTEAVRGRVSQYEDAEPRIDTSPTAPTPEETVAGEGIAALEPPPAIPQPADEPPRSEPYKRQPAERTAPVRDDPGPTVGPEPAARDDRPAVKTFAARPDYPEAARLAGIAGTVIVEAEIDTAGSVASTRVLRGVSPELDQAAREAVERWRFEPATSNGEPRSDLYRAAIRFELKPPAEPEAEVASLPEDEDKDFEPPVRLYAPPPSYPPADWVAAVEGDVVVKAAISETGRVTGVEVLQGLSAGLNKAAIEALEHWRFRPATRQGEAVAAHQVLTFRFAR